MTGRDPDMVPLVRHHPWCESDSMFDHDGFDRHPCRHGSMV